MAGDWIMWTHGLAARPEVLKLAQRFSIDRRHAAGCCMLVWEWFDMNSVNGHAPSVTRFVLDDIAGELGFTAALIEIGWLLEEGDELVIPNFERWNSQTAKSRALATRRKQRQRKKEGQPSRNSHAASVTPSVTKTRPETETEIELTTPPTVTAEPSRSDSKPKPKTDPPPTPESEPEKAQTPEPKKPPAKTWAGERYDELLSIVPDITFARGMPLLNKLKKTYSQPVVEQVINRFLERSETVALKDIFAVFTQRCKDVKAAPAVSRKGVTDGAIPAEDTRYAGGKSLPKNWSQP